MKILKAEVINVVKAKTRYGEKLCLNSKLIDSRQKTACWSNDLNNPIYLSKKPGDIVELIEDDKGKYSVLDREETVSMNRPSSNGSEGSYYTNPHPNNNGYSKLSNEVEDVLDLPHLSDTDKRKMMEYIRSQSKLLKFCYDTVCKDFPTLEEYDSRGARSLAISLLISANQARDRYLK